MPRLFGIVTILLALVALMSPSLATGVCVAQGGLAIVSVAGEDAPVHLPNPCEMQGGKRVLPAEPDFSRHAVIEHSHVLAAQWARGLMDEPRLEGRPPALELPPPRQG